MDQKDRQRRERRRRRKQVIWQGGNPDDPFAEIAAHLNATLYCGWCGFPTRAYTSFLDDEPDAVMVRDLPGAPEHIQLPVHMACMEPLEAAIRSGDLTWQQRVMPHYIPDDPI